ncbi:MAG: S41 family peptidase [Planctomycetia bacterium]
MPKRNLLLLSLITAISLLAWLARDHARQGRQVGEVVAAIERAYLEPVDPDALAAAALDGVLAKLDEHSALVDGAARRELEATLDQEFAGVGLELVASPDGIVVHSPVAGGPAWRAGVRAGDVIVAIDGVDARRLTVRDAVSILRGDAGSAIAIGVRRPPVAGGIDGAEAAADVRTLSLTRELVRTDSVLGDRRRPDGTWEWLVEGEPGLALVRITSFGDRTAAELDAALDAIAAMPGLRGLVLDLRGNPGGLLTAAVDVCDRFLDDGVIVATRRRGADDGLIVEPRRATPGRALAGVPMAVLIDGLTASAAEIVAACLQDHGRAVVVGSRSFGKGTVQSILPLSDGRRLLKLTTAEYLRPSEAESGRRGGGAAWGVSPDAGRAIDVTGQTLAALQAWRRLRDAVPPAGQEQAAREAGSAGELPRHVDPVLAAALQALVSPEAHLRREEETARDAHEAVPAGKAAAAGEGLGG